MTDVNQLNITDRPGFIDSFIGSITRVTEDCILDINSSNISCLCATSDGTLVQYNEFSHENTFDQIINIPDIKRLHKIMSCTSDNILTLNLDNNSISYKSPETRFKFYLLDDGILQPPAISLDKIKTLEYDNIFEIDHSRLTDLIKGSTFTNESEKMYIYTDDLGDVYGELTDKEKPNMDSFCVKLASNVSKPISPLAFNFENIRIVSSTRCDKLKFSINTTLSIIRVDIAQESCNISYIISALIK
tara:strand:+ start:7352 stop:8089 length:738 start_codon:yes stop_codon:yes gene_type:complete